MGFVLPVVVAAIGVWIAFAIVVWATGHDTLLDNAPSGAPPGLGEDEPITEAAVATVRFDTGLRGYRTDQVDAALDRLAWELGRRDEQLAVLRAKLGGEEPEIAEGPDLEADLEPDDPDLVAQEGIVDSEAEREEPGDATPRTQT